MNIKNFLVELIYSLYTIGLILLYPLLIILFLISKFYKCCKCLICNGNLEKSLAGQIALVTGSGRGLGREIAIVLAQKGCHIAVVDVQGALAEETATFITENYGVKTKAYKIDITDYQQLLTLKTKVTNDLGDVTILVNNAGIVTLAAEENPLAEDVQRMTNVNFTALVNTTYLFLPKMKQLNRGYIVNVSSMAAIINIPMLSVYGATKSAVQNFTATLRLDLMMSDCQVSTTAVLPTFLTTNKRINDLVQMSKISLIFPSADGSMVAQYAIKAMLHGDEEVTVPKALRYTANLMDSLPTSISNQLTVLINMIVRKKTQTQKFRSLWDFNDVQANL